MEKPRTKAEVEALLAGKDASIARRLDTIKSEVGSAGVSVKKVFRHPLLAVGATLAGGLLVGRLLGGKRGRKAKDGGESTLTRDFYELVAKDAERLMRRGLTPREAVREALRRRAPLVLDGGADESPGLLRSLVSTAGRMFVTVALRNAMESAVARFMGGEAGGDGAGAE
jgi:hypothetical protein